MIIGTNDPLLEHVYVRGSGHLFVYAPVNGSPAIDAALPNFADYDQFGSQRPMGNAPDIGALEGEPTRTVVTTLADIRDPFDFETSLVEALDYAAVVEGENTITFADGLEGTIDLVAVLIDDDDLVAINGDGRINLRGSTYGKIMQVSPGTEVSLTDLDLIGKGHAAGRSGFGILNEGVMDLNRVVMAGVNADIGILNEGTMTLIDSTVTGVSGRGIVNEWNKSMIVERSTISGNSDGGISNSGTMVVSNSTISGNTSYYSGAGIDNGGYLTMSHTTVTGNHNTYNAQWLLGAGLENGAGHAIVSSSIVSGNTAGHTRKSDDIATFSSTLTGSGNLFGVADADLPAGNLVNVTDPRLGPLADNGGLTLTHLPMLDSLAIGLATTSSTTTDQRGVSRTLHSTPDAGAVEVETSIVVTTLSDVVNSFDGVTSIREAITVAATTPGDNQIRFDPSLQGTILLNSQLLLNDTSGSITIDGNGRITLDANRRGRVLQVLAGTTAQLDELTLTGGYLQHGSGFRAISGGAVFNTGHLSLVDSVLIDNEVAGTYSDGGAIFNDHGTVILDRTTVLDNVANDDGGAIGNYGGTVHFIDAVLEGNVAGDLGGAIDNRGGQILMSYSEVLNNRATNQAGAIFNDGSLSLGHPNGGKVIARHSVFQGNQARLGGALYNLKGTVELWHSTLSGNQATEHGGAIYNDGTLFVWYSLITENRADSDGNGTGTGGGIYNAPNPWVIDVLFDSDLFNNWRGTDFIRDDIVG